MHVVLNINIFPSLYGDSGNQLFECWIL